MGQTLKEIVSNLENINVRVIGPAQNQTHRSCSNLSSHGRGCSRTSGVFPR